MGPHPSFTRRLATTGMAALMLVGTLAASVATADAQPRRDRGFHAHQGHHGHYGRQARHGRNWVAPAIIGGLALGAFAASRPYHYGPRCWVEPRRVVNRWGQPVIANVEVCR